MSIHVNIDELQEGMILTEPVINSYGQILIPSGISIQSQHKRILTLWNISSVMVRNGSQGEETNISPELRKIALDIINIRKKWKPRNDIERNLIESAVMCYSFKFSDDAEK